MDRGGNGWEPYSLPSLAGSAGCKKKARALELPGPRGPAGIRGPGRGPGLSAHPALELRGCWLVFKGWFFLCRSETFGTHKNQFQEGIRILEQYLEVDPRLCPVGGSLFSFLLEILIRLPGWLLCPVSADETEGVVGAQKRRLVVHAV